jgi:hypothetical protein
VYPLPNVQEGDGIPVSNTTSRLKSLAGLTGYGYGQVPQHLSQQQDPQTMEPHGLEKKKKPEQE